MSTQPQMTTEAGGESIDGDASRRCWRCLNTFACAPADIVVSRPQWWLCDPCRLALLGARRQPAGSIGVAHASTS